MGDTCSPLTGCGRVRLRAAGPDAEQVLQHPERLQGHTRFFLQLHSLQLHSQQLHSQQLHSPQPHIPLRL